LALNAKGGESNRPKAKGPHHHPPIFKFSKTISQRGRNYFKFSKTISQGKKLFQLQKPSWQLRGELLQGAFN
jgi:hypothetical protein